MIDILCPYCSNANIGKSNVILEIEQNSGDSLKREIFVCLNCGTMFVEAQLTSKQKKILSEYRQLNPFDNR